MASFSSVLAYGKRNVKVVCVSFSEFTEMLPVDYWLARMKTAAFYTNAVNA